MLPLECRLDTDLSPNFAKLIGCSASAVNMISSNPCVSPSPRIRISFSLLSMCRNELISSANVTAFLPKLPSLNKDFEQESNPMS